MPKFLIEVQHDASVAACTRAIEVFLRTGSHFLSHADWGCEDGEHKAWLVVDVADRDEARNIVPPDFRPRTRVVQLRTYSLHDVEESKRQHGA
jgi:hypothetical protein